MYVNFLQDLGYKFINLKLKFRNNRSYGKKRTVHWCIVTSLLLELLKQRLIYVTPFRHTKSLYSRSVPFRSNALIILVMFIHIVCIVESTRTNSRHTTALFFPFSICRNTLPYFFIRGCSRVITLPVSC